VRLVVDFRRFMKGKGLRVGEIHAFGVKFTSVEVRYSVRRIGTKLNLLGRWY
jgi:hypothetical protein